MHAIQTRHAGRRVMTRAVLALTAARAKIADTIVAGWREHEETEDRCRAYGQHYPRPLHFLAFPVLEPFAPSLRWSGTGDPRV
jgi:hypothetical protein